MHRIIVAIDVEAPSLKEAYRRVYQEMAKLDSEDFQWESTDEWYDDEGDLVHPDKVQEIRMAVFAEEHEG
jgi:hypothetical protein